MRIEALWAVQFVSTAQRVGGGVVVYETGRILGGDSAFVYVGSGGVKDGIFSATVACKQYGGGMESVFGPIKEFTLQLSGPVDEQCMQLRGSIVGYPQMQLTAILTRAAELP